MVVAKSPKKPQPKKPTLVASKTSKINKTATKSQSSAKDRPMSRARKSSRKANSDSDVKLSFSDELGQTRAKYSWKIKLLIGLVICLGLVILGLIGYGALNLKQDLNNRLDREEGREQEVSNQSDGSDIEKKVRDLIEIPEEEALVNIAYINSQEALDTLSAGQSGLLSRAEIGDYYLVFDNRAILYRTSSNKIIEYTPIIR
ncbi:hypothetical protein KA531_00975 [Candidatus Saccharibacteria bacterium]|nr:hypothetical protein [Candidatus Saccharibacteria bacterium]